MSFRPSTLVLVLLFVVAGCPEPMMEPLPDAFRMRRDAGPDVPVPFDADDDADLDAPPSEDDAAMEELDAPTTMDDVGPLPCGSSAECTLPSFPVCNGMTGMCVECSDVEDAACGTGEYCEANACVPGCDEDLDCTGAGTLRCRVADHTCVGCASDGDCALGTVCDLSTSACVPGCSALHGCGGIGEECCGGDCIDTTTDEANCGGCGLPCAGVCVGGSCTFPVDCAALHAASPALPSGVYEIDPEGDGIAATRYCDMTTDGGGWTLVARMIAADGRVHVSRTAVGLVDSPVALTAGKLSDDEINTLRNDLGGSVIRLDCAGERVFFQDGARMFDATRPMNAITRCAPAVAGPYEAPPGVGPSSEIGVSGVGSMTCAGVRFADTLEGGCFDSVTSAGADGALWVRRGATQPPTGCAALLAADPSRPSGVYTIDPDGSGPRTSVRAYCDMTSDGGGWTFGMIVSTNTDTVGSTRLAGYTEFGTAAPPSTTTTYGIDLSGMRFSDVRIENFTRPAVVSHSAAVTLTWGGTEYRSVSFRPAMRFWLGGAMDLRAGYLGIDPACVAPDLAIPVCLADDASSPDLVCDTDLLASSGMLDCMGGEHCGMPIAARAWSDADCISYSSGGSATYGIAVR